MSKESYEVGLSDTLKKRVGVQVWIKLSEKSEGEFVEYSKDEIVEEIDEYLWIHYNWYATDKEVEDIYKIVKERIENENEARVIEGRER